MTGNYETPIGRVPEATEGDAASVGDEASVTGEYDAPVDDAEEATLDAVIEAEVLDPLTVVTAERDEYLDSLRRLQAEFENYRKRVAKQQSEQAERAAVSLVNKLLPVLDALDLAATHLGDPDSDDARALVAASSLLNGALEKEGLDRIDPMGQPFDPNAHEAVGHLPADVEADQADREGIATATSTDSGATGGGSDGDPGDDADVVGAEPRPDALVVAQVMRAGYRWKGTVVRPAMVMVLG